MQQPSPLTFEKECAMSATLGPGWPAAAAADLRLWRDDVIKKMLQGTGSYLSLPLLLLACTFLTC